MKPLVAGLAALALALSLGLSAPAPAAQADPGGVVAQHVLPAAPTKTTKPKPKPKPTKPSATPSPTPETSTVARTRTAAEEEGERWVQIAMVAGGGLLGCVAIFFAIGAFLRRRPRPRS
ncbi:MAG TPA: hypothetical protein VK903_15540 [Propionicimonas sp.]|nr:hypothetical protein [Propionicimonas sp.]